MHYFEDGNDNNNNSNSIIIDGMIRWIGGTFFEVNGVFVLLIYDLTPIMCSETVFFCTVSATAKGSLVVAIERYYSMTRHSLHTHTHTHSTHMCHSSLVQTYTPKNCALCSTDKPLTQGHKYVERGVRVSRIYVLCRRCLCTFQLHTVHTHSFTFDV